MQSQTCKNLIRSLILAFSKIIVNWNLILLTAEKYYDFYEILQYNTKLWNTFVKTGHIIFFYRNIAQKLMSLFSSSW